MKKSVFILPPLFALTNALERVAMEKQSIDGTCGSDYCEEIQYQKKITKSKSVKGKNITKNSPKIMNSKTKKQQEL
jgi:hypothetical protein